MLRDQLAHRILHVLRLKPGDSVWLFDGSGQEFKAKIITCARHQVQLQLECASNMMPCSPLFTHLVQAISRHDRMDYSLQKATELGVNRITPVVSDYSNFNAKQKRHEHWQGVIIAAAEQCGRTELPLLDEALPLKEFIVRKREGNHTHVILHPTSQQNLRDLTCPDLAITIITGAEGGFSPDEMSAALNTGIIPIQLGPRVLRTETVAAVVLGCVQFLWGDMG